MFKLLLLNLAWLYIKTWHICPCSFRLPWHWWKVIVGRRRHKFNVELCRQLSQQQGLFFLQRKAIFYVTFDLQTLYGLTVMWIIHNIFVYRVCGPWLIASLHDGDHNYQNNIDQCLYACACLSSVGITTLSACRVCLSYEPLFHSYRLRVIIRRQTFVWLR